MVYIWRINVKTLEARETLLSYDFKIKQDSIEIFDKNPFKRNSMNRENTIFRYLPYSVPDQAILKFLIGFKQVTLQTGIEYAHIQNENESDSVYENGDRFIYAIDNSHHFHVL